MSMTRFSKNKSPQCKVPPRASVHEAAPESQKIQVMVIKPRLEAIEEIADPTALTLAKRKIGMSSIDQQEVNSRNRSLSRVLLLG